MTLLRMPDDSFYGLGVLFQRPQLKTCWLISCRQWQPTNVADDHDDDDGQWRAWKGFLCCHLSKVWKIDWILLSSVYLMQKWVSPIGIKHRLFTLSVLIIFIIFILKTWSTVVYTFDPFCERSCWRHLIRRRIALDVHYLRVVVVCCAFVLPAKLSLWCMYKRTYIHVYIRTYYAYSPCPDPPPPPLQCDPYTLAISTHFDIDMDIGWQQSMCDDISLSRLFCSVGQMGKSSWGGIFPKLI